MARKRSNRKKKRWQRNSTRNAFDHYYKVELTKLLSNYLKRFEKIQPKRRFYEPKLRERTKSDRPARNTIRRSNNVVRLKSNTKKKPVRLDRRPLEEDRKQQDALAKRLHRDRVCRGRVDRRIALFAKKHVGKGKGGPKKRRLIPDSKIRC